jgi:hypothetical protein
MFRGGPYGLLQESISLFDQSILQSGLMSKVPVETGCLHLQAGGDGAQGEPISPGGFQNGHRRLNDSPSIDLFGVRHSLQCKARQRERSWLTLLAMNNALVLHLMWRTLQGATAAVLLLLLVLVSLHRNRELHTEAWIDRPPTEVWKTLADTQSYPSWNPFIRRMDGDLREGERIEVELGPQGSKPMVFKPKLLTVQPGVEIRWQGQVWMPGIFDGEHRFQLIPEGGGTRLIQSERFSGLLVGRLTDRLLRDTLPGFVAMNQALKQRVESSQRR